jgi:nucleoside-diphosphate-sugar epimerase
VARKSVGITGAAGVIGTILRRGLGESYDLTLFDQKEAPAHGGVATLRVDCGHREELRGRFDGLDALIHLAGDPRPNAPRASTLRNNFVATSFTFDEARAAQVPKVVFASSNFYHEGDIGEALGGRARGLITLDRPPTPQCPYGESKVFGEQVGRHLAHLGTQFVALRIGWAVPDDDPARYGGAYMRAVYCSHRDLVQAFARAIEVETDWLAAFAVSRNGRGVFDLAETRKGLGFEPRDDAEERMSRGGARA